MARAMLGMPAKTNTFSMRKPGALLTGLSTSSRAARNARHLEPRLVERPAAALQALDGVVVQLERHAERLRDALGRDVVVRRADAARREDVGELAARLVHVADDRGRLVAHDAALGEPNAELRELEAEELQIRILRLAGQDLVADDEHAGRRLLGAHGCSPFALGAQRELDEHAVVVGLEVRQAAVREDVEVRVHGHMIDGDAEPRQRRRPARAERAAAARLGEPARFEPVDEDTANTASR